MYFCRRSRFGIGSHRDAEAEHGLHPFDVSAVLRRGVLCLCGVTLHLRSSIPLGSSTRVRGWRVNFVSVDLTGGDNAIFFRKLNESNGADRFA